MIKICRLDHFENNELAYLAFKVRKHVKLVACKHTHHFFILFLLNLTEAPSYLTIFVLF